MRWLIVLAGVLPVLSGCGEPEAQHDANAAAVAYSPPTVTSRLDFGGQIERRFHRFDVDSNDRLSPDELPPRVARAVPRWDTNGDGQLNSDEWGAMLLAWFDRNDANKDGTLTSEEIDASRERARAEAAQAGAAAR